MRNEYRDIRERIADPPKWWDEFAVPRYCEFAPEQAADMYAAEAALVLIKCWVCGREFQVCMSGRGHLASAIGDRSLHYGDPPNSGCCVAGPMTDCVDLRVLEFWRRHDVELDRYEWRRDPSLEIELKS
jgi:hypothetical protein